MSLTGHTSHRPGSVYWRRRGILAVAAAALMGLGLKACAGGSPPDIKNVSEQLSVPIVSTYTPTPTPTATATGLPYEVPEGFVPGFSDSVAMTGTTMPVPSDNALPTAKAAAIAQAVKPVACDAAALAVSLKADAVQYSGKTMPKLFIGVKNMGPAPCQVDLGSKALSFVITSGKDRIWSSDDCQGKGEHDIRLLKPGQELWARSVWGKVRSAPGCPKGEASAKPGYYVLDGSAGGVKPHKRVVFQVK
jgi:hypothetical protein